MHTGCLAEFFFFTFKVQRKRHIGNDIVAIVFQVSGNYGWFLKDLKMDCVKQSKLQKCSKIAQFLTFLSYVAILLGGKHAIFTSFHPIAFSTRLHCCTSLGSELEQHKIQGKVHT